MRYLLATLVLTPGLLCGCYWLGLPSAGIVNDPPVPTATFTAGGLGLHAGEPAWINLTVTEGNPPLFVAIDMGGGADNVPAGTLVNARSRHDFILRAGGPFTYTVRVTDAQDLTGTVTGTYGPVGPMLNQAPQIESAVFSTQAAALTVTVADPEGDDVTIQVSDIPGLNVQPAGTTVTGGNGVAVFEWSAADPFTGVTGTTLVEAFDNLHEDNPTSVQVSVQIEGWPRLAEGVLAAVPGQSTAAVGETVTVRVMCGDFPAAAPFAALNSVAITFEDGGAYVDNSLNVGAIGGGQKDADGLWATMDPPPKDFMLPKDFFILTTDVTANSSLDYLSFNITPVGAGEVTRGGDLCNFGIAFSQPGTFHLGVLEFQDVSRTYYSDSSAINHNWLDVTNNHAGIPNSILVHE